jgi:hypothetical protein
MTKSPTPELIDKERRVVELRRAGATWDDISRTVGYTDHTSAYRAYQRAMKRTLVEAGTEEIRELELDRLDKMQTAIWGKVMQGDTQAIHTALKILDRRAKYLGLDAPVRSEVKVDVTDTNSIDAEMQRLVALLAENDSTPK